MAQPSFFDIEKFPNRGEIHCHSNLDDLNFIRSLCPTHGTINAIVQHTIKSVAADLRASGFSYYSPEIYPKVVACICNSTSPRIDPAANNGHGTGAVAPVCIPSSVTTDQPTDIHKATSRRGGKRGAVGVKTRKSKAEVVKA